MLRSLVIGAALLGGSLALTLFIASGPRSAVLAAQPTPMVSVTTLPALPSSAPTAMPLSSPSATMNPTASLPPLPPPTMSPQDLGAHAIIQVGGLVAKPLTLSLKDLERMRATSLTLRVLDPDGRRRVHTFTGVLLSDIISEAHPQFGNDPTTLADKYVTVTSVNGATAIVGFPEFVPEFNGKRIIVAYLLDLQNLPGPGFAMLAIPEDSTRVRFLTVARLTVGEPQL